MAPILTTLTCPCCSQLIILQAVSAQSETEAQPSEFTSPYPADWTESEESEEKGKTDGRDRTCLPPLCEALRSEARVETGASSTTASSSASAPKATAAKPIELLEAARSRSRSRSHVGFTTSSSESRNRARQVYSRNQGAARPCLMSDIRCSSKLMV